MEEEMLLFDLELKKELELLAKQCCKDLQDIIREKIKTLVYGSYSPQIYDRTETLLNSINYKIGSNCEIIVFIDPVFNTHINNQGLDVGDNLANWLNDDYKHKNWNGGNDYYHQRPKSNFIEESLREIRNKEEYDMFKFKIIK